MHDNRSILEQRIQRTLIERILPAQTTTIGTIDVEAWRIPLDTVDGRPVVAEPVPFEVASKAPFVPFAVGTSWGAPWQTTWFRATVTIPELPLNDQDCLEVVIDLGWDDHSVGFQCEAQVRDMDGHAIKALNPKNRWIPLPTTGTQPTPGTVQFMIEAAANPLLLAVPPFQVTADGDKLTSSQDDLYTLRQADLVIVHHEVEALALDIAVLREMIAEVDTFGDAQWRILFALNDALDALDLDDVPGSAAHARAHLAPFLSRPALPGAHTLSAVGHAHIDTAWLWPLRETRRKVVRTLSNVVNLIEGGSGLIFALPAAQHMAWIQEDDPDLFDRIRACVADGSIVPVGGMWVEPDAVLPGGEAMCRQLVEGMGWIEDNLDYSCTEIWLPDSFGYSAALPQIAREAGIHRFLTQKISWNQVNVFPHHTLLWEGIDGSRIFTHFPPVDTYGAEVTGANLAHAVDNFKNKGRASVSMLPFGYGDGGGGPTREMLGRIERFSNLEGAPKVVIESPTAFFDKAEVDQPNPPVWVGELYLELHRGTLTSQIKTKQGNRRSEALLREAELWATIAALNTDFVYPHAELQEAWRTVLLCQFHDILPGTSIAWVYREVDELYGAVREKLTAIIEAALKSLCASAAAEHSAAAEPSALDLSAAAAPSEVAPSAAAAIDAAATNTVATDAATAPVLANATSFPLHGVPPFSIAPARMDEAPAVTLDAESRTLDNGFVRARFDEEGACVSFIDLESGRDYIPAGARAGEFHLHQDFPNMWDAWDIDPFYRGSQSTITGMTCDGLRLDHGEGSVRAQVRFGSRQESSLHIEWRLRPGEKALDLHVEVDWHETEKLLKLAIPADIHTDHAQYETQMGHIVRATHENTSWDAYKFEVGAHRWLRLANAGASLAIANDATYGWDITRMPHEARGTWAAVRATLVKSAQYPDPHQDQGHHAWNFRLLPGASVSEAIAAAQDINLGRRVLTHPLPRALNISAPFTCEGAVVESVSLAGDGSGDILVRAYEAEGGPRTVTLTTEGLARLTDLRYRPRRDDLALHRDGNRYTLEASPFQILTFRITPAPRAAR